ncbi:hypothetical protein PCASD_10838 [Puccinia coronata f. sp. avenae]|uniref:Piwi domain-containing protein n=1 Tax=Puccinia coronata f. sp. avenae TaxID=200324 RepID=A0A2N5TAE6_9BASI|nr:hypothetical protein PCASD_10838 [Puccinia coronata f. sp. avenae]
MTRPANGLGSNGNLINVQLNLFNIAMSPTKDLFHYNIEIFSSKDTSPPIALKKRIFKEIHAKFATSLDGVGPVFDGDKTVYCHKELAPLEGTVEVESFKLPPRKEEFKYILMAVEKPKWRTSDIFHALFGPQGPTMRNKSESDQTGLLNTSRRAMQALNVAIRYLLAVDCPSTSRAFFPDQAPSLSIGGGVLLRRGYITHMRLGNTTNWNPPPDNLFLAMDMTCAAFLDASPQSNPANTLTDLCCKILNVAPTRLYALREDEYRKLHKVLRRFKIDIKRGDSDKGITKSIDHLTLTNSQNEMFETDEGRTSVEAFFLKNWGKRLHYPNLPNVVTMGSGKKTVYPMELCSIRKGQRYILKLGSDQQSSALKFQTIKPAGRFQQIMVARQHVMNSDHEKLLAAYGIRIGKDANLRIPVRDGQWNIAKPNLQFITPKVLKSWAVVVCTGAPLQDDPIMNFLRALRSKLIQLGVQVAEAPPPIIRLQPPGQNAQVKEALERAGKTAWQNFQKAPPQLFLCITDERSFLYNSIKVEGDNFASRGVTTQCMVLKHVKTPKDQYLSNLALKINVPTMIVGADLTHNNLSAKMKPSIAALVGSLDWTMLKYAPAVGVQPLLEPSDEDGRPRSQEPIQLFRTLLTELLEKWEKNNPGPKFPRKMIIFRDGVSDGEFTQVLESEFKAAKAAVEKIAGAPDQCKITYNHRLRMSPDPQCQDRSGNAPAGTVLDHRIGDPNSSADDLQKIIQTISSGFQRATRSVGLATPAYYADIVASRAKMWLNADDDGASTVVSTASGRDQTADERAHDLEMYQNRIQSMMARLQSLDQQMWWI